MSYKCSFNVPRGHKNVCYNEPLLQWKYSDPCNCVGTRRRSAKKPRNLRHDLCNIGTTLLLHTWPKRKEILLAPYASHSTTMHHTSVFSLIIKGRLGESELGTRGCLTLSSMYPLCVLMTSFKALIASCAPCVTSNTIVISSHGWSCACWNSCC